MTKDQFDKKRPYSRRLSVSRYRDPLQHCIDSRHPLGKIRHKNVIRRHDETRRRNDLGSWLHMKVSRTSFCVATFSRRCDNVVYVAMSLQRFYDVRDVKKRPENFHIQPNIQVLSTSGFDGRRLAEWALQTIVINKKTLHKIMNLLHVYVLSHHCT